MLVEEAQHDNAGSALVSPFRVSVPPAMIVWLTHASRHFYARLCSKHIAHTYRHCLPPHQWKAMPQPAPQSQCFVTGIFLLDRVICFTVDTGEE